MGLGFWGSIARLLDLTHLMFAWWRDFGNPMGDARRSWRRTFFCGHHSLEGAGCQVLVANSTQKCTTILSILWCLPWTKISYIPQWQSWSPCIFSTAFLRILTKWNACGNNSIHFRIHSDQVQLALHFV
jgi:hypothetical protein